MPSDGILSQQWDSNQYRNGNRVWSNIAKNLTMLCSGGMWKTLN